VNVAVGDFEGADGIFKEMRDLGMAPLGATYLAYIYGCMHGDDAERAYKMLTVMEAEWRIPDARAYENMLRFFGRRRHMDGQLRCIKAIVEDASNIERGGGEFIKLPPPLQKSIDVSLSSLIRHAQDTKEADLLVELQELARRTGAVLNSSQEVGVIYTMLENEAPLQAFERAVALLAKDGALLPMRATNMLAERLAVQASMVDDAYYMLETRNTEGESVPIHAVNIVIEACANMGDLDRAFATWAELEQLGLKPDAGTYNALLHACVRTRELASGRRLLNRMEMDEVAPNANTFAHRCSLLVMSRQGDAAIGLVAECIAAGLKPTVKMCQTCINYLLRGRRYEEVGALIENVRKADVKLNEGYLSRIQAEMQQ